MKIMYIHGFGSKFDPNSAKIKSLKRLGDVVGMNLDYTQSPDSILHSLELFAQNNSVDLFVGTSLGAWYASQLSWMTGFPFIAINPAINPQESLRKYEGNGVDYDGKEYTLSVDVINEYDKFHSSDGLVLLDDGDEVFDSSKTAEKCGLPCVRFPMGSHRFDHMNEALPYIHDFYQMISLAGHN